LALFLRFFRFEGDSVGHRPHPPLFFNVPGTALGGCYALLKRWQTWRKSSWWG
jgi:hypothetical protein